MEWTQVITFLCFMYIGAAMTFIIIFLNKFINSLNDRLVFISRIYDHNKLFGDKLKQIENELASMVAAQQNKLSKIELPSSKPHRKPPIIDQPDVRIMG